MPGVNCTCNLVSRSVEKNRIELAVGTRPTGERLDEKESEQEASGKFKIKVIVVIIFSSVNFHPRESRI